MNVKKFFEALAIIMSEREGVKITVTVKRKDSAKSTEKVKEQ